MKSIHRIVNSVGYKKIYPMSATEDDSFCHYCGRKPNINLSLHWDHVPALNVKIPPELQHIRKTLVRSCSECNLLASDIPHLDFKERLYWLKETYLIRYKKLFITEGSSVTNKDELDEYLRAVVSNSDVQYQALLSVIGFGVCSIEEVHSPVLERKNKSGKLIKDVISEYLYFPLYVPEEDEEEDDYIEIEVNLISFEDFIVFLFEEWGEGWQITDLQSYNNWRHKFAYRLNIISLPQLPEKYFSYSWLQISGCLHNAIRYQKLYKKGGVQLAIDEFIAEQEHMFCNYQDFLETISLFLVNKLHLNFDEDGYKDWYSKNLGYALRLDIPKHPNEVYLKEWSAIEKDLFNDAYSKEHENFIYDEDEHYIDESNEVYEDY